MCKTDDERGAAPSSGTPSGQQKACFISKLITWLTMVFLPPVLAATLKIIPPYDGPVLVRIFWTLPAWSALLQAIAALFECSLPEMLARLASRAEPVARRSAKLLTSLAVRSWGRAAGSWRKVAGGPPIGAGPLRVRRLLTALALLAVAVLVYVYVEMWNLPAPDFDLRECLLMSLPAPAGGNVLQVSVITDYPELYSVRLTSRYSQEVEERLHGRAWSPGHGYALIRLRERDDHRGGDRDGEIEIRRHRKMAWVSLPEVVVRHDAIRYVIERGEAERLGSRPGKAGREGA